MLGSGILDSITSDLTTTMRRLLRRSGPRVATGGTFLSGRVVSCRARSGSVATWRVLAGLAMSGAVAAHRRSLRAPFRWAPCRRRCHRYRLSRRSEDGIETQRRNNLTRSSTEYRQHEANGVRLETGEARKKRGLWIRVVGRRPELRNAAGVASTEFLRRGSGCIGTSCG